MKHFLIQRAKVKSHYWDWRLQPTHDSPVTSPTLPFTWQPCYITHPTLNAPRACLTHSTPQALVFCGVTKTTPGFHSSWKNNPLPWGPWFSMMNRCYDSGSCFIIYLLVFMLSFLMLGYLGDFASHALIAFIYLYTYFLTNLFVLPKIIVFKFPWRPPSPSPPCMPPVFPIPRSKEYVLCDVSGTKKHKATLKKKSTSTQVIMFKNKRVNHYSTSPCIPIKIRLWSMIKKWLTVASIR